MNVKTHWFESDGGYLETHDGLTGDVFDVYGAVAVAASEKEYYRIYDRDGNLVLVVPSYFVDHKIAMTYEFSEDAR